MGLSIAQYKSLIVAPGLALMGPRYATPAGMNLMTGIANKESEGLMYIAQLDGGPARGLLQVERVTHDDQYNTWLDYPEHAQLKAIIQAMLIPTRDPYQQMVYNALYNLAVARVKVYRAKPPLPDARDAAGMCAYWKAYYNTTDGAGADDPATIRYFQQAIDA